MKFSKDRLNVSLVFLCYLSCSGDSKKVAIALDMLPETVEVLAAMENWPTQLRPYTPRRHQAEPDCHTKTIGQTVTLIQAYHLRDVICRVIERLYKASAEQLITGLSPRHAKANGPSLSTKPLLDLTRALELA